MASERNKHITLRQVVLASIASFLFAALCSVVAVYVAALFSKRNRARSARVLGYSEHDFYNMTEKLREYKARSEDGGLDAVVEDISNRYGEAGGESDFYFGILAKMDPKRLKEPDRKRAKYLNYSCGAIQLNSPTTVPPWLISIAILNPNKNDTSLGLKELAQRNSDLRNNSRKITRVIGVCGGVMISSYWGITAQHCLNHNRFLKVIIRGRQDLNDVRDIRKFVREIQEVVLHPDYDKRSKTNDTALFKLMSPLVRKSGKPVCLPNPNVIPRNGRACYYGGWGLVSNTHSSPATSKNYNLKNSHFLQFRVKIEDPNLCQKRYKRLKYDVNYNICDKKNNSRMFGSTGLEALQKIPCRGFSGGPLTCSEHGRWVVYGIVNWGDESCDMSLGRGYALLSTNMEWICCKTGLNIPNCDGLTCKNWNADEE